MKTFSSSWQFAQAYLQGLVFRGLYIECVLLSALSSLDYGLDFLRHFV